MSYTTVSGATITTVDCDKQVRSWRLLRSLMELLIPTCHCAFIEENHETKQQAFTHTYYCPRRTWVSSTTTGTIFGHRHGKVNFCIQTNPKSTNPLLLLELSIPTTILAREMRGGILRIALESTTRENYEEFNSSLLSMPVWTLHCNGRKLGFAFKRNPTKADVEILEKMESVSTGAGTLNGNEIQCGDEIMYLRGNFESVCRSSNSNSFHLIDPEGNIGQELSIFFLRS
ncbi:protein MIZU-KUSSEI 1-like [Actinidia eriantha]|uniref:protein MIZU-KUSSEI 1-like n=1 Tax=Actinidia eriantha TaxID=165200 RepID=UPI0025840849|nr:protein MIZU-KUSSEI 1-like [Actinidia eriantha]